MATAVYLWKQGERGETQWEGMGNFQEPRWKRSLEKSSGWHRWQEKNNFVGEREKRVIEWNCRKVELNKWKTLWGGWAEKGIKSEKASRATLGCRRAFSSVRIRAWCSCSQPSRLWCCLHAFTLSSVSQIMMELCPKRKDPCLYPNINSNPWSDNSSK